MPGMMNTFLNVGINTEIVEGLIQETKEAWFAWDNYRRFIQSWAMSFDMHRDEFDAIMNRFKKRYGRHVKRDFSPVEIRELALAYKDELKNHNIELSDSPKEQLFTAVSQVMKSWNSPKAVTYRDIMGLSEQWGTAGDHSGDGFWKSRREIRRGGDVHARSMDFRGRGGSRWGLHAGEPG